jgi:divalent metal cation (Fe/Co/Zn/Cd) transporter
VPLGVSFNRQAHGASAVNQGSMTMIRNVVGFAGFAFLAVIGFRLLLGVFGWVLGMLMTVVFWAFMGFVIYTLIKMFSPETASKIRSTIRGDQAS